MLWPLLLSLLGLALVMGAIFLIRLQNEIIRRELNRPWVVALANKQLNVSEEQD